MEKIRILIANKYFLMNYAIKCILQKIKGFEVYGVEENGIISEIEKLKPEILVLEIEILKQDSFRLLSEIKNAFPNLKILVLLDIDNKQKLLKILQYQLDGYLLKNTSQGELIEAANTLHKGEKYYGKEIHNYVMNSLFDRTRNDYEQKIKNNLSNREREILQEIITGKNNREIADQLFISEHTVLTHRRNIMRKLKVKSTPQLIITSFKHGLINIKD